ncbi:MAG: hypothetical protein GY820_17685 [Gammaproteobacteria bacterium]|nr:hypothetical protein [Gammaproteobacteria bacterium]
MRPVLTALLNEAMKIEREQFLGASHYERSEDRLGLIADTGQDPLEICSTPAIAETIEPTAAMADAFEQAFERYRALYPAISGIGERL